MDEARDEKYANVSRKTSGDLLGRPWRRKDDTKGKGMMIQRILMRQQNEARTLQEL
jgi:hypothetical protein